MNKIGFLALSLGITFGAHAETPQSKKLPPTSKIIGGLKAQKDEWPYAVALVNSQSNNAFYGQFCGASFIGDRYVLTAAHCVYEENPEKIDAIVGAYDLSKQKWPFNDEGSRVSVQNIYVHENYDPNTKNNDIAILELDSVLDSPTIPLANKDFLSSIHIGDKATVIGWGVQDTETEHREHQLYQVDVPYVSREECQKSGGDYTNIDESAICAGDKDGGKDSCWGDSGGPLIRVGNDGVKKQIGVVSWGIGCAEKGHYGVYANVAHFKDWVQSKTNGISYPENIYLGLKPTTKKNRQVITIRNYQDSAFNILDVSTSPNISISYNGCENQSLDKKKRCDIHVDVTPTQGDDEGKSFVTVHTDHPKQNLIKTKFHTYGLLSTSSNLMGEFDFGESVFVNSSPWKPDSNIQGQYQAGNIDHGQSSVVYLDNLPKGTFSFSFKTSSEKHYDWFTVRLNGNIMMRESGLSEGYKNKVLVLPYTKNSISFSYQKDVKESKNDDTVYIKDLKLNPEKKLTSTHSSNESTSSSSGGSNSVIFFFVLLSFGLIRNQRSK